MFTVYTKEGDRELLTLEVLDMENLPKLEEEAEVAIEVKGRLYRFLHLSPGEDKAVAKSFYLAVLREFGWNLNNDYWRHLPMVFVAKLFLFTLTMEKIRVEDDGFLNPLDNRVKDLQSVLEEYVISGSGLSTTAFNLEDCGFKFWPIERDSFGWLIGGMKFPTGQKLSFG